MGTRKALLTAPSESATSQRLSPNEHLSLLVELLRPVGPELARRWLAALLLVPEGERRALVSEVERRIVKSYASQDADDTVEMHVVSPPIQRDGYVEEIHTIYEVVRDAARRDAGDAADARDAEAAG